MSGQNSDHIVWALSSLAGSSEAGDSLFLAEDQKTFQRQVFVFALLNLFLIGSLLLLQEISRLVRGKPAASVIEVLVFGFLVQAAHLIWLRGRKTPFTKPTRLLFTYWSLAINSPLALVLTLLTIRGDTAYYALMLIPILEAAFRLGLGATSAVILPAVLIS